MGLGAVAALAACNGGQVRKVVGCQQASDCGSASLWKCDTANGVCQCLSSAACSDGGVCNPLGYCQAQVTCFVDADCSSSQICDLHSNVCIPQGSCTADDQCAIGTLCDKTSGTCQPGCHDSGDCTLGQGCLCHGADGGLAECVCPGVTEADRDACAVGQCSSSTCPNTGACPYGDLCESDGGGLPVCTSDYDPGLRPFCDACTLQPGEGNTCDQGANFCLIDTANADYGETYCGVDCSQGQPCPNGYDCDDVVVVRSVGCSQDSDCQPDQVTCQQDSDCPNGGRCAIATGSSSGFCAGHCAKGEGDNQGFCTCVVDNECDQDVCNSESRTCSVSQEPCTLDQGCLSIKCVSSPGGWGGCLIGQNCAPESGLTCADVRP
jgi:hypothetical protein